MFDVKKINLFEIVAVLVATILLGMAVLIATKNQDYDANAHDGQSQTVTTPPKTILNIGPKRIDNQCQDDCRCCCCK